MADIPEQIERHRITNSLRAEFKASLQQRVDRYVEVSHQAITPNPHFAAPSAECIKLYRDGYSFSTVMVTQAVAEGILKFVVKRKDVKQTDGMKGLDIAKLLVEKKIISIDCAAAFERMGGRIRNIVHHMDVKVVEIDFPELAKKSIQDLASIEQEIFAFDFSTNTPHNPEYWDARADGKIGAFLRFSP